MGKLKEYQMLIQSGVRPKSLVTNSPLILFEPTFISITCLLGGAAALAQSQHNYHSCMGQDYMMNMHQNMGHLDREMQEVFSSLNAAQGNQRHKLMAELVNKMGSHQTMMLSI